MDENMDDDGLKRAIERTQQEDVPCVFCKRPTRDRAVFVPKDPAKLGMGETPTGAQRMIIYSFCDSHPRDRETAEAVERVLGTNFGEHQQVSGEPPE